MPTTFETSALRQAWERAVLRHVYANPLRLAAGENTTVRVIESAMLATRDVSVVDRPDTDPTPEEINNLFPGAVIPPTRETKRRELLERINAHHNPISHIVPSPPPTPKVELRDAVMAVLDAHPDCAFTISGGAHFECGITVPDGRVRDARRRHLEIALDQVLAPAPSSTTPAVSEQWGTWCGQEQPHAQHTWSTNYGMGLYTTCAGYSSTAARAPERDGLAERVETLIGAKSFGVVVPGERERNPNHNGAHEVVRVDDLRALLPTPAPQEVDPFVHISDRTEGDARPLCWHEYAGHDAPCTAAGPSRWVDAAPETSEEESRG